MVKLMLPLMQSALLFLAGIVLLCLPCAWFFRQRIRFLSIHNFLENPGLVGNWLSGVAWWNLIRAGLGAWMIRHAEAEFLGADSRHNLVLIYNGAVQLAGLSLQMVFYRNRDGEVLAPVSYLFGILLAVLPPAVALPAIAFGVATAAAVRSLAFGWASTGLLVTVLGILLAVSKLQLAKFGLLFGFPLLWILGSNRQFVIPVPRLTEPATESAFASRLR